MRVLIACEESQTVCKAFRAKGHEAYSCDILPCSGGHPEWHIQDDVLKHLDDKWDMMIAHPPCTYLSHAANGALKKDENRIYKQFEAVGFFLFLYHCDIPKICIENPRGWIPRYFRHPDQIINPFNFGDPERKRTNLWLKGLPPLMFGALNPNGLISEKTYMRKSGTKAGGKYNFFYHQKAGNAKLRSKTFPGIAAAMADQWG